MRIPTRLVLTALAALVFMAMAASTATARERIESSEQLVITTSRALTFAGTINQICDVTLHATLLRLIQKVLGSHVGGVTEGRTRNCTSSFGGSEPNVRAIVLNDLILTYSSIEGSLPNNIRGGVLLVTGGFLLQIRIEGLVDARCLYRGRIGARAAENPIRTLRVTTEHREIPLAIDLRGRTACPANGTLRGEFRLTPEITLRLLEV